MIDGLHLLLLFNLCWYMFLWTITDHVPFESFLSSLRTKQGLLTIFLVAVMILQVLEVIHLDIPGNYHAPLNIWLGVSIMLAGMTLASWAKIVMKSSWGVPAQHDIKKQKALVTTGPFSYMRNPIYVGLFLFVIGFEIALTSWLVVVSIPLFFLIRMAIAKEELLLEKYFGGDYILYKKRVPRLLPL